MSPNEKNKDLIANPIFIQLVLLIVAGLIFYGVTTTRMEVHGKQLESLESNKAEKEAVMELKLDIREVRKDMKEVLNRLPK